MIQISPAARQEIRRLQKSRQQPDSYLRLGVKAGGCSGLYYTLELSDSVLGGDRTYTSEGINIVVGPESQAYLEELSLDYAEDLMGGGFRFHNPLSQNPCACGLSFSIDKS